MYPWLTEKKIFILVILIIYYQESYKKYHTHVFKIITLLKLICNADITLQWIFPSFSHSDSWIHHWSHKFRTVSLKLFGIHLKKCNLFVITHGTKSFWFIPITGMILHHKMIKLIFLGLNTHWPVFYAF